MVLKYCKLLLDFREYQMNSCHNLLDFYQLVKESFTYLL